MKNANLISSILLTVTLLFGVLCIPNTAFATNNTTVDFVFIIDSTGSMGSYIDNVNNNLTKFVTELSNQGIELRMAVIDFRDVTVFDDEQNETTIHEFNGSYWTNDVKQVIEAFNSIQVDGGGDLDETPTEAIKKALEKLKTEEDWYNDGHKTFMLLLTDADYKESSDSPSNPDLVPDMNTVVYINRNLGINTTVVSQGYLEERYKQLYSLTGGIFIDINSDNYDELMNKVATWIKDSMVDSDGDGLPDDWETKGVTIDGVFIDFPSMGANPRKPDVFIEADWMEYVGDNFDFLWIHEMINKKSTAPSMLVLKKIYDQFNSHGIKIHIDAGPDSIMNYDTGETWGELSRANALPYQEKFELGNYYENWNKTAVDNFTRARWTTFRYCLFVNRFDDDGTSGIAENIPGQFFIVSSGCIGGANYDTALAGTFMHELGHTLGLSHGGLYYDASINSIVNDHNHYKRNHLSIMNYTYQFSGLSTVLGDHICNYQDFNLPEIDENHVNESRGIDPEGATDGKFLTIKLPVKNKFLLWDYDGEEVSDIARKAIDFNKNGIIENDIVCHLDKEPNGKDERLGILYATLNEWNNLKFTGGLISGSGEEFDFNNVHKLIEKTELDDELNEMTVDEAFEFGLLGDIGECEFDNIDLKTVCSEITDQSITIDIINKYPEKTRVGIKISSDVLSSDYITEIDVDINGAKIDIPLKSNLDIGEYSIDYSMILPKGKTINKTGTIKVIEPEKVVMNLGESINIPSKTVELCISSDNNVVDVVDNMIVAKSIGTAYLTIILESRYYAKVDVIESNIESNAEQNEESSIEPSNNESSVAQSDEPNNNPSYEPSDKQTDESKDNTIISPDNSSPTTGDNNHLAFMFFTFMISFFILMLFVKCHRKEYNK